MEPTLEWVDLGRATIETKFNTIVPTFFDGVGWSFFRPWW
jgi:hypothetical protein